MCFCVCEWRYSLALQIFVSLVSPFWSKIEFFRKKREKRATYFQGEDGYDKRDNERSVCFVKSESADQAKVFQESAKKKTRILILAHVFTTLNKTHLHKHHVCCYSTNRVRRRPQGHQGSGVYSTARSFFLFNNTDLIIGVFFSQSALLMMRIFFRI